MRWLAPPPQRTAYFSRARRPGVVLRVSRTMQRRAVERVGPPPRQRGHAGEVAQQVERRALGGQQRPGRRRDAGDLVAGPDAVAVGDEVLDVGGGVAAHRVDRRGGDGEPGDARRGRGEPNVPTLRWSAGTVATDVTSTPPIRSSATAIRTSAATASGSSPAARRRWRVVVGQRVELSDTSAASSSTTQLAVRGRAGRRGGAATLARLGEVGRGGGSRGSRCGPTAAATTADADRQQVGRLPRPPGTVSSSASTLPATVFEHACRGGQRRRVADHADVARHRGAHLGAQERRSSDRAGHRRRASGSTRSSSSHARSRPEAGAGHDALGEAVRGQAVGPVHAGARHLADGEEPGDRGRAVEARPGRRRRRSGRPGRPGCGRGPGRPRWPGRPR